MNVALLHNQLPREKWAKRIAAAWQKQVPGNFEVSALLEAAKAELADQVIASGKSLNEACQPTGTRRRRPA